MSIGVSQVRLVFNVEAIAAVSVSSNWLYLTGSPTSVVRINLDSPSNVQDIHIPKKHLASCGQIRLLTASPSGKSIFCVTSRNEHFYFSEDQTNLYEFKYLGKLKGMPTACVCFYPKRKNLLLLGTKSGGVFEVLVDSSANETYFKRDLKYTKQVWNAPIKEPVTAIHINKSHNQEATICCGSKVLKFIQQSIPAEDSLDEGLVFRSLFSNKPEILVESDSVVSMLTCSPDLKTLAVCLNSHKVAFHRRAALSSSGTASSGPSSTADAWEVVDIASKIQFLLVSNYYLLVIVESGASGSAVMAINLFDQSSVLYEPIENSLIKGGSVDHCEATFWLFGTDHLFEVKLENELRGMWKVLADQKRFEEALDIADSRAAKSDILKSYGLHELNVKRNYQFGAKLLGLSDFPLEIACVEVMKVDESSVSSLLLARLSHTKSKAQQIMLTSWLVDLGDLSVCDRGDFQVDYKTLQQILRQKGLFDKFLQVSIACGDVEACVSYYISNRRWSEALDILRRQEPESKNVDIVYKYALVLMQNCPRDTVESWMRMPSLDIEKLLPSLIAYASAYRGQSQENQALRYLLNYINARKKQQQHAEFTSPIGKSRNHIHPSTSVFNAIVTILSEEESKGKGAENEELLKFLRLHAQDYQDLDFALRICLNFKQFQSAIYLYTLMGLHEDAVELCLSLGGSEMYEQAVEIAEKQSAINEELRKHLLRLIAHRVIVAQGPHKASRFVGLLRVGDLLSNFPDFETLSELAPEIIKSLEHMNTRLSTLNLEIDETLLASESMQQELSTFSKRSVLVEPGERCFLCHYPLVTRKFVVFPCQHGFHADCTQRELEKHPSQPHKQVTDECVLCSKENINQIEQPLSANF